MASMVVLALETELAAAAGMMLVLEAVEAAEAARAGILAGRLQLLRAAAPVACETCTPDRRGTSH